ncbi:hypothetical protein V8E36_005546 [Tilletia maclaganii]
MLAFYVLLLTLAVLAGDAQGALRGAPWGVDDRYNRAILGGNSSVVWYHHWQLGPVATYPGVEYVPTLWGPQKNKNWAKRKNEMALNPPANILAFNEPDLPSQANMTPAAALDLYMSELWPLKTNFTSVKLSSPQICFNITWLNTFMAGAAALGATPDFLAIHWYGAPRLSSFQLFVNKVHAAYPSMDVWVTELGLTNKSNVTVPQAQTFMSQVLNWTDTQPFIKRVTWTGFFTTSLPPDSYISPSMALFNDNGTLTDLGTAYSQNYEPTPPPCNCAYCRKRAA